MGLIKVILQGTDNYIGLCKPRLSVKCEPIAFIIIIIIYFILLLPLADFQ